MFLLVTQSPRATTVTQTPVHRAESEYETRILLAHFADDQYKASQRRLQSITQMLAATKAELEGHEQKISTVPKRKVPIGVSYSP